MEPTPAQHSPNMHEDLLRILELADANTSCAPSQLRHVFLAAIQQMEGMANGILHTTAELRTRYNKTMPVRQLPPEVLRMIFSYATSDAKGNADIISISHVCSYWRACSLQAPALWAHILLNHPAGIKVFLERSRPMPLRIAYKASQKPVIATLRLMAAEAHRLRSLNIYVPEETGLDSILNRIRFAAPMLEELVIKHQEPLRPPKGPEAFSRPQELPGVPSLRTLTLKSTPLPYILSGPSSLVNLNIFGMVPFLSDLFRLLANSPKLESVKICGTITLEGVDVPVARHVDLPSLKNLHIEAFPPTGIAHILSRLTMPATVSISIRADMDAEHTIHDVFPIGSSDGPPNPCGLGYFSSLRRMVLSWSTLYGLELRAYRSTDELHAPALRFKVGYPAIQPGHRFLADWPFDASQVDTLVLCGDFFLGRTYGEHAEVESHLWMEMFQGLPELKTLRVMSLLESRAYDLLEPLATSTLSDSLCPKLETLELFDIVPAGKEFTERLYNIASYRGAQSSGGTGMLRTVELFNAGHLKEFMAEALRLPDGYEVEILQE